MLKTIAATAILGLSSLSIAHAGIITQSVDFGTQGSSSDIRLNNLNETLSINPFDTSLGDLIGVTIRLFGQIDSEGLSRNFSASPGRADMGLFLFSDWNVTSVRANIDHDFATADPFNPLFGESSPPGTFPLIPGTANDTLFFDLSSGLQNVTFMGNTNAFTSDFSSDTIDFNFTAMANTRIDNEVASGTGMFMNVFESGVFGSVEVDYNFTPSIVQVSEPHPAGLGLLGALLFGASMLARRKA
jgi:hypothetical protein